MAEKVICPVCGTRVSLPNDYQGGSVRCLLCKAQFVPSMKKAPAAAQPPRRQSVIQPPRRQPSGARERRTLPMSPRKKMLLSAIGKIRRGQADMEAELSRATRIQFNLLPERIPNIRGFDMKVYYQSAKEVGGDYYDFIPIDRENLGIVVADASGKGVPAGMIMTMGRTALHLLARGNPSAKDVLVRVNRFITRDIKNFMFLTILYMVLNVRTTTLQVVNAGHNPLILWREGSHRLLSSHGIAVGLDRGPLFEKSIREELIQIQEGDRVIAYTDGVVESMNERGEEFGEERFLDLISRQADKSSAGFLNCLIAELQTHQGRAAQHDDITVVTFRYG